MDAQKGPVLNMIYKIEIGIYLAAIKSIPKPNIPVNDLISKRCLCSPGKSSIGRFLKIITIGVAIIKFPITRIQHRSRILTPL